MENGIIYIDKVGLEGFIVFHEAEFDIMDGYYFNSSRDNGINDVIENLYGLGLELNKRQKSCTGCY